MATRILVQCKTRQMPGSPHEKIKLMAESACRKVWNRSFDDNPDGDRLISYGGYYNPQCILLVDHGPVDAKDYTTIQLSWNGQELVDLPGPVHPYIRNELETRYQFNPANRPTLTGCTDEELKEAIGLEKYNEVIQAREEQFARGYQE